MTNVYRPIDVLEVHNKLINWYASSPHRDSMDKAFGPLLERYRVLKADGTPRPDRKVKLSTVMADRLNRSETIYVRSDIVSRLWDFTDVYETHGHEWIAQDHLPCDRGFVYLERSIHILDSRGQVCSIRGIMWSAEPQGVLVVMMSDWKDELDDINRTNDLQRPGWRQHMDCELPVLHVQSYMWGTKVTDLDVDDFTLTSETRTPGELAEVTKGMGDHVVYQNRFTQFLLSLWEFMGEQIPQRMPPDRPMRKRLQRAHSSLSEVSIIQLRPYDQPSEPTDPDHVPQFVPWSHRWRVRAHKRRWIDKKTGELRETTVREYTKGPPHLQLIEKDRVFHVKR